MTVRPFGLDYRGRVTKWAYSQVGRNDPLPYWRSALGPRPGPYPKHWCGAFALAALHAAGLALDVRWIVGSGFLLRTLDQTRDPLPGDIAYFRRLSHHAIVGDVEVDGALVELINGNSRPYVDGRSAVQVSRVLTNGPESPSSYFSIERFLDSARTG